jgi:hypothetical protein
MTINVHDKIKYRPDFGKGKQVEVTVIGIGEHKDCPVLDLNNNHWCYLYQVDEIGKDDNCGGICWIKLERPLPIINSEIPVIEFA